MKLARFLVIVAYGSYLTNIGLILLITPWTDTWAFLILKLPPNFAFFLDQPMVRGAVSAFGFLHLVMILLELLSPSQEWHFLSKDQ